MAPAWPRSHTKISIHAPREGSDMSTVARPAGRSISIHAPREGSDLIVISGTSFISISIHAPREGSDIKGSDIAPLPRYFYPRSPRGERPRSIQRMFSILQNFYPRSPRGERQWLAEHMDIATEISIHAPREGSDTVTIFYAIYWNHFYPRSPRGERLRAWDKVRSEFLFLSTLPARGATIGLFINA